MNYNKYLQFWGHLLAKKEPIITDYKESVFEIDFAKLKQNTDLVIFDFDDTLVDFLGELTDKSLKLIKDLQEKGWKVAIFSNCTKKRLKELKGMLKGLDIFLVTRNDKPSPDGFLEAIKHFGSSTRKTLTIGDKIGTEMYGAYLSRVRERILVEPYSYVFNGSKANVIHRFIRNIEKFIYFKIFKNEKKQNKNK
jgi:predicted HAD superfamily phosphohydrolase YqeG